MGLEADVKYLMDRIQIQDVVARYGLGQDFHQPLFDDNDMMKQWSMVFTDDAIIDYSDVGFPSPLNSRQLVELMRGTNADGGMISHFTVWQHIEAHAVVTINGDTATSINPHLHTHETKTSGQPGNVLAAGIFYDQLERRPEGWRIVHRRLKQLYTNFVPRSDFPIDFVSS